MNTDFADLFDILNEGQEFEPCFMKVMVQKQDIKWAYIGV